MRSNYPLDLSPVTESKPWTFSLHWIRGATFLSSTPCTNPCGSPTWCYFTTVRVFLEEAELVKSLLPG
jgi:hypothetical protein